MLVLKNKYLVVVQFHGDSKAEIKREANFFVHLLACLKPGYILGRKYLNLRMLIKFEKIF